MRWLRRHAASDAENNLSQYFRRKRINLFFSLLRKHQPSLRTILDIGGANYFWANLKDKINCDIILINKNKDLLSDFPSIVGDANKLSFIKSKSVDVIFSNSLIEHLGDFENQKLFADEVKRISKYYFIQTPAYVFPIEPHFLFPFFHWFSGNIKLFLIRNLTLGWYTKTKDKDEALKLLYDNRIMKKRELKDIFPEARIIKERFFFLTKSYFITNLE